MITWAKTVVVAIAGVAAFVQLVLIPQRLLEREICALAFIIGNAFAHVIAPVILLTSADASQYIFCFALLNLFGDIVKLLFLKVEDEFEVHLLTRQRLFVLTFFTAFLYFSIIVFQVVSVSTCGAPARFALFALALCSPAPRANTVDHRPGHGSLEKA